MEVDGRVDAGFEAVAAAFEGNFADLGELGAAVAVFHGGRLVVDLTGGRDLVGERPFTRKSLVVVGSCTKVAIAKFAGKLVDRPAREFYDVRVAKGVKDGAELLRRDG